MLPFSQSIRYIMHSLKLPTKTRRTKRSDINQLPQQIKKDIDWDNELNIHRSGYQRPIVIQHVVFRFDR